MSLNFSKHMLIAEHCIPSGSITRSINAEDEPADARVGQVGSLAMLNPDPSVGFIDEREWFGILTWIQPVREAMEPRERTCEVFWVYTKEDIELLLRDEYVSIKPKDAAILSKAPSRQAWISDHFSDEPVESIITIPTLQETKSRIKLSARHYIKLDFGAGTCEFVRTN